MSIDKNHDVKNLENFLELRNLNHISNLLYYIYYHLTDQAKRDSITDFKSSFDTQTSVIGGVASIVTVVTFFQTVDSIYKIISFTTTIALLMGLFIWRQMKSKKIEETELAELDDTLQLAIFLGQILQQSSEVLLLSKLNRESQKDIFVHSLLLESFEHLRTSIVKVEEITERIEKSKQLDNALKNIQYNRELLIERIATAKSILVHCDDIIQTK